MNNLISRISTLFALAVVALTLTVAVQPAAAQFGSDGTTLNDFVLDADGYAWFKAKPYGATLKPSPQLRFIADPGNARGGNALHPDSHKQVEDIIKEVIRDTGSWASWEISWTDAPGLAGGYQVKIRTDRGSTDISAVQVGLVLMKYGKDQTKRRLIAELAGIL